MKKLYFIFLFAWVAFNTGKAQYVTIPDTTFVNWLQSNGYSACMNGNQLDTTCGAVLSATTMNCYAVPVRDLAGIQYFKNLDSLDCSSDSLYNIPALPPLLTFLNCGYNNLINLPLLPTNLLSFQCAYNKLTSLPVLPPNLADLYCENNKLTSLPSLPTTLRALDCSENISIDSIPPLPPSMWEFGCEYNSIRSLPPLPSFLRLLSCSSNQLTFLPVLPDTLFSLSCSYNIFSSLPALPLSLEYLYCDNMSLNSLPILPPLLQGISCANNQLTILPSLPPQLKELTCYSNNLTSIPLLPATISRLECGNNPITSIPDLPDSLFIFDCSYTPNLSCLPQLKRIINLDFTHTAINCLPNYGVVNHSSPPLSSLPLCGIYNPNGCQPFWNISGQTYYDQNINCNFDSIDVGTNYVKTQLYDNTGALIQQTFTGGEGYYSFDSVAYGSYTVQVDTSNLPFVVSCPGTRYYNDTLSAIDSLSYNNNFAFKCRTQGFDVGVQSVLNNYVTPRPNAVFTLNTIAGDMSELYGAHCATGISGQVQIIFNGQTSYVGPAAGALTPTVTGGNTFTWSIADFGAIDDFTAFNLRFKVDSLAVPGSTLCFSVSVTPTASDYNPGNNALNYCFPVVNALDPNEKEVWPPNESTNLWLTYTIRFQNTGTAAAVNVRITDTLDSHFDPSTFQLLTYSAKNLTQIFGNTVVFNFPNINLPDSATSDSASRGYIQYKIKLKNNLPLGTVINNTAYIYFDLNNAVVTNTTTNVYGDVIFGISNVTPDAFVNLYPNPAHNYTTVSVSDNLIGNWLQLTDAVGRVIINQQLTGNRFNLTTGALSRGVYLVRIGNAVIKKLVVE